MERVTWHSIRDVGSYPEIGVEVWAYDRCTRQVVPATTKEFLPAGAATSREQDVWWLVSGAQIEADRISHWTEKTDRPPPPPKIAQ